MARIAFNESIGTDRDEAIVGAMVVNLRQDSILLLSAARPGCPWALRCELQWGIWAHFRGPSDRFFLRTEGKFLPLSLLGSSVGNNYQPPAEKTRLLPPIITSPLQPKPKPN